MTETSSNNLFANLNQAPSAEAEINSESQVETTEAVESDDEASEMSGRSELDMLKARARIMGIKFSNAIKVETLKAKIEAKLNEDSGEQASDEDESDVEDEDDQDETDGVAAYAAEPVEAAKPVSQAPVAQAPAAPALSAGGSSLLAQLALMSSEEKAAMLALLGGTAQLATEKAATASAKPTRASTVQAMRDEIVSREMALVRCRITNMDPKKKDIPGEIFTVANEYLGTVRKYVPYGEQTDDGYHLPVCIYNQLLERTFVSIRTVKNKQGRGTVTTTSDAREFAIEVLPPLTQEDLARLANAQAAAAGN